MITYVVGDATNPLNGIGSKLIVHICNDHGGWGAGFVLSISKRWSAPEFAYRQWYHEKDPVQKTTADEIVMTSGRFGLGETQLVRVSPKLAVVNMIAQEGYRSGMKGPPIRYDALKECLRKVNSYAFSAKASVHMPRIGCALAGGSWAKVEPIIQEILSQVSVTVYDYPGGKFNP